MASKLQESGVGYGTFWLDFAEAFATGKLKKLSIACPTNKDAYLLRQEFYSFRSDVKETYPELLVLKAMLKEKAGEEGEAVLTFVYRDQTETSLLLQKALIEAGVLTGEDGEGRWKEGLEMEDGK